MHLTTRLIEATDGTELFVRRWHDDAPADRTLLLVHGAGEHGGRYEQFAAKFVERRWEVIAPDARGHGQSKGIPTHIERFDQYVDDLAEILRQCDCLPERTALFAHSMGGLVCVRLLQTHLRPLAAALALSSPLLALQLRIPVVKKTLGRLCSWILPQTRFASEIRPHQLTRDEQAQREREDDPYRHKTVTAGWYFQMLDAMYEAWADVGRLTTPLLLQQGDADEVVNTQACLRWWTSLTHDDRLFRLQAGHLHELAFEPSWPQMADFVMEWLESRIPVSPARPPSDLEEVVVSGETMASLEAANAPASEQSERSK
jgi:lysophospholipase